MYISQLPTQCAAALNHLEIVAILLANGGKSLEFHRCESVQNLVVFFQICGIFLRLSLIFLIAVAGIILNWFLILSKNEPRVVLKLFS